MRILFHATGGNPDPWLADFKAALPEADLRVWQPGDDASADYAIVWKPPAEVLRGRAGLKAVFNLGAGVDAILQLGGAVADGVAIVRLDDAGMAAQMAEYVTWAVLRYFRRLDVYEAQAREGRWKFQKPHARDEFAVGMLGLGVLGARVAQTVAQFGFPVNGWSRTMKSVPNVQCYAGDSGDRGLPAFLRATRALVCLLPLTAETDGILNAANLGSLPQGAYLINVARGAHLVEQDLLQLVQNGHIAGATLDVFREEPLPADHPFWKEPRITITPHMSALTLRGDSVRQIAAKIRAMRRGDAVAGVVDRTKGY